MFKLRSLQRKVTRSLKQRGFFGTVKRCVQEPLHLISKYRPSQLRARRAQKAFDQRYGVDTAGVIPLSALDVDSSNWEHGFSYEPTDPEHFKAVIAGLPIRCDEFTFVDFGSGKGKALLLAADFPFHRVLGVEISDRLHHIAESNLRSYKNNSVKCTDLRSICSDASSFDIPNEKLVIYFFNPFQEPVMTKVLSNIAESLRKHPRKIFIIYKAPLLGSLMDRAAFLEKIQEITGYAIYKNAES